MPSFIFLFVGVLAVLFGVELLQPVQEKIVLPWTAFLAAMSANLMSIWDSGVMHQGRIIHSATADFGVSIEAGCNGIEAVLMLVAAIVAFPSSLKLKLAGILAGSLAIQAVNILRIVTLYYLGQWNEQVFEFAHLYLWQALIMLDVLVVWLIWIRAVGRATVDLKYAT